MIQINKKHDGAPFGFATNELRRCLIAMCGEEAELQIDVGLFEDFGLSVYGENDAIDINVTEGYGYVAASTESCILYAVYRLLRTCGANWPRPGRANEYLPLKEVADITAHIAEQASYQHRGVCIEGSASLENVLDMVDWMPKYGLNSYFIQFREGYIFFARWYEHRKNDSTSPCSYDIEDARRDTRAVMDAVAERGLRLHMTGHGWTCEPFGIPGLSWDEADFEMPEELKPYFALVNGERKFFGNKVLNTNLCWSNPKTIDIVAKDVCMYLKDNPKIDALHLWLSDGTNNVCECYECQKQLPSDFYVMLLNKIDELLTREKISTKIVFLIYVDLLWPPENHVLHNQDRFLLMFAPITRTYTQCFSSDNIAPSIPMYRRNELQFPESVAENLAFLQGWKKMFHGDGFVFDYHLMWDHLKEFGYYDCARIIHDDMVNLRDLGLNGNISCQLQRLFVPNSLPMVMLAETLWNRDRTFEDIADEFFEQTYGEGAEEVRSYLSRVSELYCAPLLRRELELPDESKASGYVKLASLATSSRKKWAQRILDVEPQYLEAYRLLEYHAKLLECLCPMLKNIAQCNWDEAHAAWEKAKRFAQENESNYQQALDVFEFVTVFEEILTLLEKKYPNI